MTSTQHRITDIRNQPAQTTTNPTFQPSKEETANKLFRQKETQNHFSAKRNHKTQQQNITKENKPKKTNNDKPLPPKQTKQTKEANTNKTNKNKQSKQKQTQSSITRLFYNFLTFSIFFGFSILYPGFSFPPLSLLRQLNLSLPTLNSHGPAVFFPT